MKQQEKEGFAFLLSIPAIPSLWAYDVFPSSLCYLVSCSSQLDGMLLRQLSHANLLNLAFVMCSCVCFRQDISFLLEHSVSAPEEGY